MIHEYSHNTYSTVHTVLSIEYCIALVYQSQQELVELDEHYSCRINLDHYRLTRNYYGISRRNSRPFYRRTVSYDSKVKSMYVVVLF